MGCFGISKAWAQKMDYSITSKGRYAMDGQAKRRQFRETSDEEDEVPVELITWRGCQVLIARLWQHIAHYERINRRNQKPRGVLPTVLTARPRHRQMPTRAEMSGPWALDEAA